MAEKKMAERLTEEITLRCGVYGEGSVFSVEIKRDASVEALQKKIADNLSSEQHAVPSRLLTLYLARKEGETTWMKHDRNTERFLKGGMDTGYDKMLSLWKLNKTELFGPSFTPEDEEIHVLVELPAVVSNKRRRVEMVPRMEQLDDVPHVNIEGGQYVTLPAAFLDKCGYKVAGELMLYCRRQVRDLWTFVHNEVIVKNGRGFIVGPAGNGKSVATLSFVASLDHKEWNVVWIHLGTMGDSCLALASKTYWLVDDLSTFELPRVSGRKLLICLDGFKATTEHELFFKRVFTHLDKTNERLVVCTSMATLGKRNVEDDRWANIQVFSMYSWTHDEYVQAIANPTFYDKIVSKLDATSSNEVNEDAGCDAQWSEEDKKKHALDSKFYYAGGSCRFMFQYGTDQVITILKTGIRCAANEADLVKYCVGDVHSDTMINTLYGMQWDGDENTRFPVSSYAASLLAKEYNEKAIAQLAARLNVSNNNPSVDGHLLEWLLLASVPQRAVRLLGDHGVEEVLPQANVLGFDPKKRFKVVRDGQIKGAQRWLQPTVWNQGGYDAVYFDQDKGKVIFVQVTRSDTHDFKMRFFYDVLDELKSAGMEIKHVVVYFVVKPAPDLNFKIDHIEDRDVLYRTWMRAH